MGKQNCLQVTKINFKRLLQLSNFKKLFLLKNNNTASSILRSLFLNLPGVDIKIINSVNNTIKINNHTLKNSYRFSMAELFRFRDADGYTPFMLAVCRRAYPSALFLFDVAKEFATDSESKIVNQDRLLSMICPADTSGMSSPLYLLCCNDTCSFTWTGTKHIRQNIFECRTCGLMGTLCCCTECARVCHRGHDCKYDIYYIAV